MIRVKSEYCLEKYICLYRYSILSVCSNNKKNKYVLCLNLSRLSVFTPSLLLDTFQKGLKVPDNLSKRPK